MEGEELNEVIDAGQCTGLYCPGSTGMGRYIFPPVVWETRDSI